MTKRSTRTSAARPPRGLGAFTLVEVLVASLVAVAVAGAAAAALWQAFRVHARVAADRPAEDDLARLALFEALRADVFCAAPLALVPFEGDARGFSAARLRAAPGGAPAPASVVRFSWAPAPDGRSMLRREAPPGADLSLAAPARFPAPDGAPRFSYAALVPDPVDTNAPPSLAWSDDWTDPGAAPALVRAEAGGRVLDLDLARAGTLPGPGAVW
ncbi:MAG: hypothetical protein IJV65_05555 [Kiritimatiellae bacterium]|nr:hypothetical protein [Kiritimatiellia bacterium]